MKARRKWSGSLVAAVLVLVTLVAVIGSASAATSTKPYTAQFDAGPVTAGSSDGSVTVDLVLTNLANPQTLGSANVTAQTGFTITAASLVGTGDVNGTTFPTTELKLRNLNIAPSESRTITMNVTTPCSVGANDKWGIRAKQSNDFSGPPGNDFSLDVSESSFHTAVGGTGGTAAELVFTQQPTSGAKNTSIAPAVKVEVVDSCGSAITPTGAVTLALNDGDTTFGGGGTLQGTTPTVSGAEFTFGSLSVTESGVGYTLTASYPGVADVDSSPFDVYDTICTSTSGCSASNGAGTQIAVQGFGGTAGVSVGPDASTADCGSLTALGSTFAIVPLSGTTGTYTATLTIPKRGLQGVGVSNIVVCVSPTSDGPLAAIPACQKKNPRPKCILSKTSSNAGDAIITMLFDGDPFGGGFS